MAFSPQRAREALPAAPFRFRHLAGESLWVVPAVYVSMALALVGVTLIAPPIDPVKAIQVDATLLTSVASGMLALAGFVIAIAFVTVEFASIAMSPRLVGILRRDRDLKRALGLAFGAFVYSALGALLVRADERSVDDLFGLISTVWSILAALWFVVMLDRITNTLRVGNAVAVIGDKAREQLDVVHPFVFAGIDRKLGADSVAPVSPGRKSVLYGRDVRFTVRETTEPHLWDGDRDALPTQRFEIDAPNVLAHAGRPGTLVAVDVASLARRARQLDTAVHLLVPVGRFVPVSSALLRVDRTIERDRLDSFRSSLVFATEPTLVSDPRYAFRVLVDIGLKGLAPGVNDPTTAVQAIDQMHDLLRRLAWRQLGEHHVSDADGRLRVTVPAPSFGHYLRLACEELADFGARHAQVRRALRVMLDDLVAWVPPERSRAALQQRENTTRAIEALRPS